MLRSRDNVFQIVSIFYDHMNMSFHRRYSSNFTANKNSNGIPNETKWNVSGEFEYDHQILRKKLV